MFTAEKIIGFIRNQLGWLKGSADNEPGGASSKKLSGFYFFALVGLCTIVYLIYGFVYENFDLLIPVMTLLLTAGLAALGINSSEKKKGLFDKAVDKKSEPNKPNETEDKELV